MTERPEPGGFRPAPGARSFSCSALSLFSSSTFKSFGETSTSNVRRSTLCAKFLYRPPGASSSIATASHSCRTRHNSPPLSSRVTFPNAAKQPSTVLVSGVLSVPVEESIKSPRRGQEPRRVQSGGNQGRHRPGCRAHPDGAGAARSRATGHRRSRPGATFAGPCFRTSLGIRGQFPPKSTRSCGAEGYLLQDFIGKSGVESSMSPYCEASPERS